MKHVLICPVGQSYGVVTEALWCMLEAGVTDEAAPIPEVVHVLTTKPADSAGPWRDGITDPASLNRSEAVLISALARVPEADREAGYTRFAAFRQLLHEKIIQLYELYGKTPPNFVFEAPWNDATGGPLADARTAQEGVVFENALLGLMLSTVSTKIQESSIDLSEVVDFKENADVTMHVLMAGGRKFMSAAARTHIGTVGRDGDKLWDVSVEPEPLAFAGMWWPGNFFDGEKIGRVERGPHAGEYTGTVNLVEFPFIPGLVTARGVRLADPALALRFAQNISEDKNGTAPIVFDIGRMKIHCRGEALQVDETKVPVQTTTKRFSDRHFWILFIMAILRSSGRGTYGQSGNDAGGWATVYNQQSEPLAECHSETSYLRELTVKLHELAPQIAFGDENEMDRIRNGITNAIELRDFLPQIHSRDMSEVTNILGFYPYLRSRLSLERTQLKIDLPNAKPMTTTAWRIGAMPENFVFVGLEQPSEFIPK